MWLAGLSMWLGGLKLGRAASWTSQLRRARRDSQNGVLGHSNRSSDAKVMAVARLTYVVGHFQHVLGEFEPLQESFIHNSWNPLGLCQSCKLLIQSFAMIFFSDSMNYFFEVGLSEFQPYHNTTIVSYLRLLLPISSCQLSNLDLLSLALFPARRSCSGKLASSS